MSYFLFSLQIDIHTERSVSFSIFIDFFVWNGENMKIQYTLHVQHLPMNLHNPFGKYDNDRLRLWIKNAFTLFFVINFLRYIFQGWIRCNYDRWERGLGIDVIWENHPVSYLILLRSKIMKKSCFRVLFDVAWKGVVICIFTKKLKNVWFNLYFKI